MIMDEFNDFFNNLDGGGEGGEEGGVEGEEEKVKILYPCPFYDEMIQIIPDLCLCPDLSKSKTQYCKNHNRCYNCNKVTKKRNIKFCHECICSYPDCLNCKVVTETTCRNHHCESCKQIKDNTESTYCKNCKCSVYGCEELVLKDYKECRNHTCSKCNSFKNTFCKNENCKCLTCHKPKINKIACYNHTCNICSNLYDIADSFIKTPGRSSHDFRAVHAIIVGQSQLELIDKYFGQCPNTKTISCLAKEKGYEVSEECLKIIPIISGESYHEYGVCKNCYNVNECRTCNNLKSLKPEVLEKGYTLCDSCCRVGPCLKCKIKSWVNRRVSPGPELCENCIDLFKACSICNTVMANDSIEFLNYNKDSTNRCCNCLMVKRRYSVINYVDDVYIRKAGLICFRLRNESFLNFIRMVHTRFNPNKISDSLISELIIGLLWITRNVDEKSNRELYLDTIVSLLQDKKNFERRLYRLNKSSMKVQYYKLTIDCHGRTDNDLPDYKDLNLLALMHRIGTLPKDLFFYILELI
jgi:hypothetical protein